MSGLVLFPGGSGTVTTTGSPASGNLTKFSGASSVINADLTGDVTTSGAVATTLATVNANVGSFTSANITVDAKGRITAAASGSGSAAQHPAYISGLWYLPRSATLVVGGTQAKDVARFVPFWCQADVTIAQLGVRITTLGLSNLQLAIYASQNKAGEGHRPTGSQLGATGNIVNTSTGSVAAILAGPVTVTCTAGNLYWLGINNGDSGATMICDSWGANNSDIANLAGSSSQGNEAGAAAATITCITTPLTFGTWGDLTSATFTESTSNGYAAIQFKVN